MRDMRVLNGETSSDFALFARRRNNPINIGFAFNYKNGTLEEFVEMYSSARNNPYLISDTGAVMHLAAANGRVDILKCMFQKGQVNVNFFYENVTPLFVSFQHGIENRYDVIKFLISQGAIISDYDEDVSDVLGALGSERDNNPKKLELIRALLKQGKIDDQLWADEMVYALAANNVASAKLISEHLIQKGSMTLFTYNDYKAIQDGDYPNLYNIALLRMFSEGVFSKEITYFLMNNPLNIMSFASYYKYDVNINDQAMERFWQMLANNVNDVAVLKAVTLVFCALDDPIFREQVDFSGLTKYNSELASKALAYLGNTFGDNAESIIHLLLERSNFLSLKNAYNQSNFKGCKDPEEFDLKLCEDVSITLPLKPQHIRCNMKIGNVAVRFEDLKPIIAYQNSLDAILKSSDLLLGDSHQAIPRENKAERDVVENRLVPFVREIEGVACKPNTRMSY